MDVITLLGIVVGIGAVLLGQTLEGGHVGSILQATAAIIVFGGTFGAVMVSFPRKDFVRGLKMAAMVFRDRPVDLPGLSKELVELAAITRREGVLALEGRLEQLADPFLRKALQLIVDGVDPAVVRSSLETALDVEHEEATAGARIYEAAGGYAPTIGILGAVLGLIHVMENLNEPSKLGGGIATAFVATVYGVGSANLLFLPFANKLKRKLALERERKILITEGVLGIQEGLNPRVLEERLASYWAEKKAA